MMMFGFGVVVFRGENGKGGSGEGAAFWQLFGCWWFGCGGSAGNALRQPLDERPLADDFRFAVQAHRQATLVAEVEMEGLN